VAEEREKLIDHKVTKNDKVTKNYKVTKNDCGLFTSLGSGPTAQGPYVLLAGCIISNVMINAVVPKPDAIARTAPRLTVNPNHL
jgi:hypothetical protein